VVSLNQLLTFGLAAFVIIVIPGPSVVFVVGRALSYGRRVALASVIGNTLGLVTIVALVAAGLGVIVQESIVVFTVLKLAGSAYLVWLGIEAVRRRKQFLAGDGSDTITTPMSWGKAIRQGYVVGASNPKGYMMLAAVLPQFIDRSEGHLQVQMLVLGLVATTIGMVSDSLWALIASQLRSWFNRSPRRGETMGAVGGVSMIGLGVVLAVTGESPH
jgi:threonine/homoserine/homoserine lactone efflux protein